MSKLSLLQSPAAQVRGVREVAVGGRARALRLLEATEAVAISRDMLLELGIQTDQKPDNHAFLVRGLRYPTPGGRFTVSVYEREVLVHFGFLGMPEGPAQQVALLVSLPSAPRQVYMLCTGAS
jgi:hypothetical protein